MPWSRNSVVGEHGIRDTRTREVAKQDVEEEPEAEEGEEEVAEEEEEEDALVTASQ